MKICRRNSRRRCLRVWALQASRLALRYSPTIISRSEVVPSTKHPLLTRELAALWGVELDVNPADMGDDNVRVVVDVDIDCVGGREVV